EPAPGSPVFRGIILLPNPNPATSMPVPTPLVTLPCAGRPGRYEFPTLSSAYSPSRQPFQRCRLWTASLPSRPVHPAPPSPRVEQIELRSLLRSRFGCKEGGLHPGPAVCSLWLPPVAADCDLSAPPYTIHSNVIAGGEETSPGADLR